MLRLWCVMLWSVAAVALVDDAMYMPWRATTPAAPTTTSTHNGHDATVTAHRLAFPECKRARSENIACQYLIRVVLASPMNPDEVTMADAWFARMVEWTRGVVYQVRGQQCSISWQMDEVIVPPMPQDHPCRNRVPVCSVLEAVEIPSNSSNSTALQDVILLQDHSAKFPSDPNAPVADAMVGFFGQLYDYHYLFSYGKARHIPRAEFFFHNARAHQLSDSINAWTSQDSLFDVDLLQELGLHPVESSFECSTVLANSVPVLYVDGKGDRQCSCQCAHGFDLARVSHGHAMCEKTPAVSANECVFGHRSYAYPIDSLTDHDEWNECRVDHLPSIRHMPYPTQNRTDGSLLRVQVTTQDNATVFSQRKIQWLAPASGQLRKGVLAQVALRSPGVYTIQVAWANSTAKTAPVCAACLAITDRFRPVSNVACPGDTAAIHELPPTIMGSRAIPTAEYSVRNLLKSTAFFERHYLYGKDVRNDVCGSEGRCDEHKFTRRDFFDDTMTSVDAFESGQSCFTAAVSATTERRLHESPFGPDLSRIQLDSPVPPGQCTRCCHLETALKEWWRDYQCDSTTSAFDRQCSGTGEACASAQCLVGLGPTFFDASVAILPAVQAETSAMMATVFPTVPYTASLEVHVLLECSAFGQRSNHTKCSHDVPLRRLVTWSSGLTDVSVLRNASNESFVFWRYRTVQEDTSSDNATAQNEWASADADDATLRFDRATSVVEMEAWSQCGRVGSFRFPVRLHLTQPVNTAAAFDQMWYQTTARDQGYRELADVLVPFKESSFAELTFDFAPTMGLDQDRYSRPQMKDLPRRLPHVPMWASTGVHCSVQLGRQAPAVLVHSTSANASIVQRMAVALPLFGESFVQVACNFSYRHVYYPQQTRDIMRLQKRFTILPQVDSVTFDQLTEGLHRLCRGMVVHLSDDGNATVVDTISKQCQQPAVCAPLFALPGVQDFSRCELEWDGDSAAVASGYGPFRTLSLVRSVALMAHATSVGMLVLAGGLLALMAMQRRRSEVSSVEDEGDLDHFYELCRDV